MKKHFKYFSKRMKIKLSHTQVFFERHKMFKEGHKGKKPSTRSRLGKTSGAW